jgi:hypothetical protein
MIKKVIVIRLLFVVILPQFNDTVDTVESCIFNDMIDVVKFGWINIIEWKKSYFNKNNFLGKTL